MIYKLRLYITPRTTNSQRAIDNLEALCRENLPVRLEFDVVDVTEQPGLAERDKILATPTLVRQAPGPVRRIIGDLSDRQRVLHSLGLQPRCLREKPPFITHPPTSRTDIRSLARHVADDMLDA